jgi:ABC transport system ATP-binding/permease protein
LNGSWTIENLSQSSYVAINQQRTLQGILQHNSVVSLGGDISFVFLVRQPVAQPAQQTISAVEPSGLPVNVTPVATAIRPEIGMPSLTVSSNIHSDQQVHILDKQILNIGRDPENDIAIAEPIVSALHAQIVRNGNSLFFVHPHPSHEKTLNGLWYQGQRIRGHQSFRKQMVQGDIFRIGDEHGTLVTSPPT